MKFRFSLPLMVATCLGSSWALADGTKEIDPSGSFSVETIGGPSVPYRSGIPAKSLPVVGRWQVGDPIKEVPRRSYPAVDELGPTDRQVGPDPLAELQTQTVKRQSRAFSTPLVNVDSQGFTGVNPPDPVLDVGPNFVVQSINGGGGALVVVLNKATGAVVSGPFSMETMGTGSCASGNGDPIILYDQGADRWFLQEFSSSGNFMCFYISDTSDPTGTYTHYAFSAPTFPDYPHFGVWPDAYYGTANQQRALYAFDRTSMLAGTTAAPMQRFQLTALPGYTFQTATPADWDGLTPPPSNAPGIIMRHIDEEAHSSFTNNPTTDLLEMYEFTVDFVTPANSSVDQLPDIVITDFNSWFINYTQFATVPQPGSSSRLDAIREVILNRLQYYNFGSHEAIVGVFPTNINTATSGSVVQAGLRWFELRRTGGNAGSWVLHQEGTYADTTAATQNRLVASISLDQSGNMALAYSMTDTNGSNPLPASVAYTGRLSSDPLSVMPEAETMLVTGSGANTSGRWGDYAAMGVDPVNECTFWYTSEYQTGSSWSTRVSSFEFEACGCDLALDTPTAAANANADNNIQVTWNDSSLAQISEYRVFRATSSGGPYELIATVTDTSPGVGGGAGYTYDDGTVSGGTTYFYVIRSSDGSACLSEPSNEVSATATGVCTLSPTFAGVTGVSNLGSGLCSLSVDWAAGASQCANGLTYDVFRSDTSGFTPGAGNLIATGITGTGYTDVTGDLMNGTEYFYIVRAVDDVNGSSDDNVVEGSAIPTGPVSGGNTLDVDVEAYSDIASAVSAGWGHGADQGSDDWRIETGDDNTTGTGKAFVSTDVDDITDKFLISPEFAVGPTSQLTFFHKHDFETNLAVTRFFDGAVLEISIDGGNNWIDLGGNITAGGYNGTIDGCCQNPLANQPGWGGEQNTFAQVIVDLTSFNGDVALIRWRMGTDSSVAEGDWKIDDIVITDVGTAGVCSQSDLIYANTFE